MVCGAPVLAWMLSHIKKVFKVSLCEVIAWTDSQTVLSWLTGNTRMFKTYLHVGNRVCEIVPELPSLTDKIMFLVVRTWQMFITWCSFTTIA